MTVPAVDSDHLEKRYSNNVVALAGLSLRVEPGEIFAVLGPNGAGKTTWISIICGLVRPTGGRAAVFGHDVVHASLASRRLIGLVPQEINFDPFFTPREVLRFQMGYYGQRANEKRIVEVLRALNLSGKADSVTRELSGGMRRRLLIGKALVHKPRIAFLDEPTAGVDVALRRDLWAYVRKLREEGTTIVLTTHYLEEAEALADRVAVIDHGKLVSLDTPGALVAQHGKRLLRVSYREAPASLTPLLSELGARLDGVKLECVIDGGDVAPLLTAAASLGAIVDARIEQPTLEDVFLALTGGRS